MTLDPERLFPAEVSDEVAHAVHTALERLALAWERHYLAQLLRHQERLRSARVDPEQPWLTLPPEG